MERVVSVSEVDWTIVRPPRLLEWAAPRGNRIEVGVQPSGPWSMQRADLAAYLLDEMENPKHVKTIIGITSN